MAEYLIQESTLRGIADAIKTKIGTEDPVPVLEMASLIEGITTGGGGSDIDLPTFKYKYGSYKTGDNVYQATISHGLGEMPDFVMVYAYRSTTSLGRPWDNKLSDNQLIAAWGFKSDFEGRHKSGKILLGYGNSSADYAMDTQTNFDINEGALYCPNDSTFTFGRVEGTTSGVGGKLLPNTQYDWIAISGLYAAGVKAGADHTITFMSEDGETVLCEKPVVNGDTSGDPVELGLIEKPEKEDTAQYNYAFGGWSLTPGGEIDTDALKDITEDKTLYAAFVGLLQMYTVKFYDGDTLLYSVKCVYGATPSYVPEKTGFMFTGWSPSIVPVTGNANYYAQWVADAVAVGTCGDNLDWALGKDGTLTISGTGDMYDYTSTTMPWYDYNADITSVVIEEGVTSIGFFAFYDCKMTSISIPDGCILHTEQNTIYTQGVINYKGNQFTNCSNLKSLAIPEGNTIIPMSMCNGCSSLESVVIPSTMVHISESAFLGTKLSSVTIPAKVNYIGSSVFRLLSSLASAVFEDTTTWTCYKTTYSGSSSYLEKAATISSSDLANTSTAATYLNNTYGWNVWKKT